VRITDNNDSAEVAAARMQAPRSLWDPTYVENSWISQNVGAIRLLPRLHQKITDHYPGTLLAFTEYNYGGANHISGTIAHADVLGIFGRDGVFAATLWGNPPAQEPAIQAAFDAFRNFDGAGGAFGDTSILATTSDAVNTSVYGSMDSDGGDRLALVAINKSSGPAQAAVSIRHGVALSRVAVYRITAVGPPVGRPDLSFSSSNTFNDTLPPLSVTTYVLTP
jgi:hypothetical protein